MMLSNSDLNISVITQIFFHYDMTVTKSVPDNLSTITIIYHNFSKITKAHCMKK